MSVSEFAAYLGVPVSDTLADMFSLFDEVAQSHSGGAGGLAKPSTVNYFLCNISIP